MAVDPNLQNEQSQTLFNASVQGFAQPPNPQLAYEAINTQAVPEVAQGLSGGDPISGSLGTLVGAKGAKIDTNPAPAALTAAGQPMDWKGYWSNIDNLKQSPIASQLPDLKYLGEIPVASPQYYDAVVKWVGDPGHKDQAKRWQDVFKKTGLLDQAHPTDGSWDKASGDALFSYMVARFRPTALWGQDAQQRDSARALLGHIYNTVGATFDAQTEIDKVYNTDEKKASAFNEWQIATRFNDPKGNPRDTISSYKDNLVPSALPAGMADLGSEGFLGRITNSLAGPLNSVMGLVNAVEDHIPVIKDHEGLFNHFFAGPVGSIAQSTQGINLASNLVGGQGISVDDPRKVMTDKINKEVDPKASAVLGPALQQAMDSQGILGQFGDWWSQSLTKLQLTALYMGGDILGHEDLGNPFDRAWAGASAHEDDFLGGLLGERWAKDHGWAGQLIDTVVNQGAGFVDPTVILSGPAVKLPRAMLLAKEAQRALGLTKGLTEAERTAHIARLEESALQSGKRIKDIVTPGIKDHLEHAWGMKAFREHLFNDAYAHILANPRNDVAAKAQLLLLHNDPVEHRNLMEFVYGKEADPNADLKPLEHTPEEWQAFVDENAPQLEKVLHIGTQYNMKRMLAGLSPNVIRRVDSGGINRWIAMGGQRNTARFLNFADHQNVVEYSHSMRLMGASVGMPEADITKWVDKFNYFEHDRVATRDKFESEIENLVHPDDLAAAHRVALRQDKPLFQVFRDLLPKKEGAADDLKPEKTGGPHYTRSGLQGQVKQKFAPAGDTGAEMSTKEMPPSKTRTAEVAAQQGLEKGTTGDQILQHLNEQRHIDTLNYQGVVFDYYRKAHGAVPTTDAEAADALREFEGHAEASPQIKSLLEDHQAKMRHYDQLEEHLFPYGREAGTPMMPSQLGSQSMGRFSLYELLMAKHPHLRQAEYLQERFHLDNFMNLWKGLAIARLSTAFRATLGDEAIRVGVEHAFMGDPTRGLEALTARALLKQGVDTMSIPGKVVYVSGRAVARGFRDVFYGAGRDHVRKELGPHIGVRLKELFAPLEKDVYADMRPDEHIEHKDVLKYAIEQVMDSPMVRNWAKAMREAGPDGAVKHLVDWHGSTDPGAQALMRSKRMTMQTLQHVNAHNQAASELESQLAKLDAKAGVKPGDYKSYWGQTEHRVKGAKGNYRDRIQQAIDYHRSEATQNAAIQEQAKQAHAYFSKFATTEELRHAMETGVWDAKTWDRIYANPIERAKLPVINARKATIDAHSVWSKALNGSIDTFFHRVMEPMIYGSRAEGFERQTQWWIQRLNRMKELGQLDWDTEKISRRAHNMASDWVQNNTYQASRTVMDTVMRNAFPFIGATMSMDRFWISQIRAHPWMAPALLKYGIKAQQASINQSSRFNLGSLMYGDMLSWNPSNAFFFSSDGVGSWNPGMGPLMILGAGILRQDAGVSRFLDQIPGWSQQASYAPSIIPGAGGTAFNVGSDIKMMAGGEPLTFPKWMGGTSLQPTDYQRRLDGKAKEIFDRTGKTPTDEEVRKEVGAEHLVADVGNYLMPFQFQSNDPFAQKMSKARNLYDKASTDAEKSAVIAKLDDPEVVALLRFTDPKTPGSVPGATDVMQMGKDELEQAYPKVIPYSTSMYESQTAPAATLNEFDQKLQQGDEHILGVQEYDQKLQKQYEINKGFQAYNQYVRQAKIDWQAANPDLNTNSAEYRNFDANVLQPRLGEIENSYPAFKDTWSRGFKRDLSGLEFNSRSISTLTSEQVIPHFPEFTDALTLPMRNLLLQRDRTAANLQELTTSGGSLDDKNAEVQKFHDWITQYSSSLPPNVQQQFMDAVDPYHWGRIQDFIELKRRDLARQQAV